MTLDGNRGYGVAAQTKGLNKVLIQKLNDLANYFFDKSKKGFDPINYFYVKISTNQDTYQVFGRITASKADYTGRAIYLAHFYTFTKSELVPAGPVAVMQFLIDNKHFIEKYERAAEYWEPITWVISNIPSKPPKKCILWESTYGNAAYGGVFADSLERRETISFIYSQEKLESGKVWNLLAEANEVMRPGLNRWNATFATASFGWSGDDLVMWKGALEKTKGENALCNLARNVTINLTENIPAKISNPNSPFIQVALNGPKQVNIKEVYKNEEEEIDEPLLETPKDDNVDDFVKKYVNEIGEIEKVNNENSRKSSKKLPPGFKETISQIETKRKKQKKYEPTLLEKITTNNYFKIGAMVVIFGVVVFLGFIFNKNIEGVVAKFVTKNEEKKKIEKEESKEEKTDNSKANETAKPKTADTMPMPGAPMPIVPMPMPVVPVPMPVVPMPMAPMPGSLAKTGKTDRPLSNISDAKKEDNKSDEVRKKIDDNIFYYIRNIRLVKFVNKLNNKVSEIGVPLADAFPELQENSRFQQFLGKIIRDKQFFQDEYAMSIELITKNKKKDINITLYNAKKLNYNTNIECALLDEGIMDKLIRKHAGYLANAKDPVSKDKNQNDKLLKKNRESAKREIEEAMKENYPFYKGDNKKGFFFEVNNDKLFFRSKNYENLSDKKAYKKVEESIRFFFEEDQNRINEILYELQKLRESLKKYDSIPD